MILSHRQLGSKAAANGLSHVACVIIAFFPWPIFPQPGEIAFYNLKLNNGALLKTMPTIQSGGMGRHKFGFGTNNNSKIGLWKPALKRPLVFPKPHYEHVQPQIQYNYSNV
jgi:hypothetical protein